MSFLLLKAFPTGAIQNCAEKNKCQGQCAGLAFSGHHQREERKPDRDGCHTCPLYQFSGHANRPLESGGQCLTGLCGGYEVFRIIARHPLATSKGSHLPL